MSPNQDTFEDLDTGYERGVVFKEHLKIVSTEPCYPITFFQVTFSPPDAAKLVAESINELRTKKDLSLFEYKTRLKDNIIGLLNLDCSTEQASEYTNSLQKRLEEIAGSCTCQIEQETLNHPGDQPSGILKDYLPTPNH